MEDRPVFEHASHAHLSTPHALPLTTLHSKCLSHLTETLQDLLRFLRRDGGKDRPVALALHQWNILEKDVLPLLLTYHTDEHTQISLDTVKLLVFLTLPPDDDAGNKIEQKRRTRAALETMFRFRSTVGDFFSVLFSRLSGPLERYESSMLRSREDDGKLIQLFVTFIRNLLLAAEAPRETRGEQKEVNNASRLRTNLVKMLHELKILSALAQMARDSRKKPFSEDSTLLIETFHLLFASQSPSQLNRVLQKGVAEETTTEKKVVGDAELDEMEKDSNDAEHDTGLDDPVDVDSKDSKDSKEHVPKKRTFIDSCRAKSTQMRHGRFGGATARQIAAASIGTKKRKSLIGSELRTAPGGYFGEKPGGGGAKRGSKGRGKDGAVMTKDTVGAFTADIEGSLGLIVSGHQTETDPPARLALAKFADELTSGGFNEILLASWNSLRHGDVTVVASEEHSSRVHSFLAIAHFFVVFARLRVGSRAVSKNSEDGDGSERINQTTADVASVSNLFDKHVFHWMRVTWDAFEEATDKRGLVLVSGLMNEMLLFLNEVMDKGNANDRFACEALVAETCAERGGDEDLLRFYAQRVKKYETTDAPLVYLANVTEALHLSHALTKKANPDATVKHKTYFDLKTVENHVRLSAHWNLNPPSLNTHLAKYFAETIEAEMNFNLHSFATLQTLHAVATETGDEVRSDLKLLRRVSAKIVVDFVSTLYQVEPEDGTAAKVPRQKYLDLVF